MKNQKLMFALFSGLFGWIWIISSVAVLFFIGMALFSDWSWWNVLYSFIVGGVAKWLARGFLDNQKRVAFEEELISQGHTPEEAGAIWVKIYNGEKPE